LLRDWITRGVNIYSAWNMVLDTHGTNLDYERVWNQNALLVVDRDAKQLELTPTYYVFRHLAQYVEVGATRVEINGDALAFENPNGSVVAVMRTTAAGNQIVSIDGKLLQFEASGNGWATVVWQ
jgi:glucosylceramidase